MRGGPRGFLGQSLLGTNANCCELLRLLQPYLRSRADFSINRNRGPGRTCVNQSALQPVRFSPANPSMRTTAWRRGGPAWCGAMMKISRLELRKTQPDLEGGCRKEEPRRQRRVYRRVCAAALCTILGLLVWSVVGVIVALQMRVGALQVGLSPSNVTDLNISFAATPSAPLPLGFKLRVRSASCTLDFVDATTSPKRRTGAATATKKADLVSADLDAPVALVDGSGVVSSVTVRIAPTRVREARMALRAFAYGRGAQVLQCSISTHIQSGILYFPLSVDAMLIHRAGDPEDDTSSSGFSLQDGGLRLRARAKVHSAAGNVFAGQFGSIPIWLNATGTRAHFHEERLHIHTGAERPLGPGLPVGEISISTDLETVVDGHVDIVPPANLAQMIATWLPPLRQLSVDPRLLEAALDFEAQASTLRPDGNRTAVAAGWRVRASSGLSGPLELLSLPERFSVHIQVCIPSLPKVCRRDHLQPPPLGFTHLLHAFTHLPHPFTRCARVVTTPPPTTASGIDTTCRESAHADPGAVPTSDRVLACVPSWAVLGNADWLRPWCPVHTVAPRAPRRRPSGPPRTWRFTSIDVHHCCPQQCRSDSSCARYLLHQPRS